MSHFFSNLAAIEEDYDVFCCCRCCCFVSLRLLFGQLSESGCRTGAPSPACLCPAALHPGECEQACIHRLGDYLDMISTTITFFLRLLDQLGGTLLELYWDGAEALSIHLCKKTCTLCLLHSCTSYSLKCDMSRQHALADVCRSYLESF